MDWFHIAMRPTVLGQYARGATRHGGPKGGRLLALLERIKWLLWHGNRHRAGGETASFENDVDGLEAEYAGRREFARAAREFAAYY